MPAERLQKTLAAAGYGSRRACEQLILEGRVAVNGRRVHTLPALVDARTDRIEVDGKPIRAERPVYFLLNKPRGVFCTHDDRDRRLRAVDLLRGVRERVFPVGRLDAEATGLLILTNDGALTQKLTHRRFAVPKTYRAEVDGRLDDATLERIRAGVWLSEGRSATAKIEIVHRQRDRAVLEITLREGRNREVRRVFARFGHKVRRLARIRMGKLSIAGLPIGAYRPLTPAEVAYLHRLVVAPDDVASIGESDHAPRAPRPVHARRMRPGPAKPRRDADRRARTPRRPVPEGPKRLAAKRARGPTQRRILPP